MLTKAIARMLDNSGDGLGRVFFHYKVGMELAAMAEKLETMEKRMEKLEKEPKASSAAEGDGE